MATAEIIRVEENQSDLHELDRLDRDGTDDQPTMRVANRRAFEVRDEHEEEREAVESPRDPTMVEERAPIEHRESGDQRDAERDPDQLEME